jgi:nicotinate-nucleotide adenylyltransferase
LKVVKTALFGGSFDPPHIGHKEIVKKVLKLPDIDRVVVVPTYLNPFKKSFDFSPKERFELVELTFSDIENVIISDYEIKRDRAVFTAETLEALKNRYSIKTIVIGADNLKSIESWKNFHRINSEFDWIIATRDKFPLENLDKLNRFRVIKIDIPASSTKIRESKSFEYVDKKILSRLKKLYLKRAKEKI